MHNNYGAAIASILTSIIGVAILSVIVSNNANTSNVITSFGNAVSKILGVAISPINSGTASSGSIVP